MTVGLQRIIDRAVTDNKVTAQEVGEMIAEVRKNGITSPAERQQLDAFLRQHGGKLDPDAAETLRVFLRGRSDPVRPAPDRPNADAMKLMTSKLDAAKEGGLSGQELQQAEAELTATYGADVAKQVMLAAMALRAGELDLDGVKWLQDKYGRMDGHIANYQQVLLTHLEGAQLLDANFDGKLDAGDLIFTEDANGKINVQQVGQALCDRVRIGTAMVESCQAMDEAGHRFALLKDQSFSADFWQPTSSGSATFELKAGIKPSDAVADIFNHPDQYQFECATALVIVYYQAMLDLLGPKDFDAVCGDLRVGPWKYEGDLDASLEMNGSSGVEASEARQKELKAGDYTYFKNWDVSPEGKSAGWQGENVIYLGDGKYYGHPFGISTGSHIVQYLNQNRNADSTRSASMLELQMRLSSDLLQLDKNPGE